MIDEKKLIEEIGEYTISVYGCDINDVIAFQTNNETKSAYIVQGICEAIDFIKEQPKVGEWIPVSEQLPKNNGFYLATLDGAIVGEDVPFTGLAEFKDGKWIDDDENYKCVIAWQPLPEPYRPEAHETKKQTNADRIRNMDDEELKDIILCPYDTAGSTAHIMPCVRDGNIQESVPLEDCNKCILERLRRELEEI